MAISRAEALDKKLLDCFANTPPRTPRTDLDSPVRYGATLSARDALRLFDAQVESRLLDLISREMKVENESFYTIGSSGHENNAVLADFFEPGDLAFLHYRSGGFFCALAGARPGPEGPFDVLLGVAASSDEPIAGGRHKVFGSVPLGIPPQTSTIASHLPKAVGTALSFDRRARLDEQPHQRLALCTFGDASLNHASAQTAINAAGWSAFQNVPVPLLMVCEDNGIGISVKTPGNWVRQSMAARAGVQYFHANGLDLVQSWEAAQQAAAYVRQRRRPAFLHLETVRLLGHAGSDVEQLYRSQDEILASEALDPVLATARMLLEEGWLSADAALRALEDKRATLRALAQQAITRRKLTTRADVVAPLFHHDPAHVQKAATSTAPDDARKTLFAQKLPENDARPRHLAVQLNRALKDILAAHDNTLLFGEDVAKKGGVYHVTTGLSEAFGVGRVFNTLLDETSILGLAIGATHAGGLPIAEIQYLAYLMNAIDQLRGEAGSMQFFSNGQFNNGMVVRIAGLAYQKGFGGHFHNDNGIAALREIPGILIGCPARPDDGPRMLRTMVGAAAACGRICVLLEPIALYMTKDLHDDGDGAWLAPYPPPAESLAVDDIGVTHPTAKDVCIVSYGNGLYMSLRAAKILKDKGVACRVVDLRWLHPLPVEAVVEHARDTGHVLIVDECRASSGIADALAAELAAQAGPDVRIARLTAPDTYIPLGPAADLVLVQQHEIEAAVLDLVAPQATP